ncbi:MAG: rod shape-determining protein MreC [Candidatus Kaiserbacteria bacterium]|nr:rod shape-determining protein MreC [Candidatus Kaiserbacteria bacterium]
MKKTFLAKHRSFFSRENFSWGAYALSFALFVLFLRLITPNFFLQLFAPIFHASDTLATESHSLMSGFKNTEMLAARNEQLMQENNVLAIENKTLNKKIADISALTNSSATGKNTFEILSGVVSRPPESPYDTLVIAAGKNDGVTLGMEAFGVGNVPLGVVSSVLANFSRVTLFSAPGTATDGWIEHSNTIIPITILGAGAGVISATITRSAGIAVGDTIFVPGPGMLPIGKVARVDSNSFSPSVTLRITPAINLFSTVWIGLRDTGKTLFVSATSTLP